MESLIYKIKNRSRNFFIKKEKKNIISAAWAIQIAETTKNNSQMTGVLKNDLR